MRGRAKRVAQMKLVGGWQQQSTHAHWQKVGAMAASHSHGLEQASARHTYLKTLIGSLRSSFRKENGKYH